MEPGGDDGGLGGFHVFVWNIRDEEVLPDGEADFPVAELVGNIGELMHLIGRSCGQRG